MCLGIPGQVVEVVHDGELALVDVQGAQRRINLGLLDPGNRPAPGDWIVIHMGFALERIDEAGAREALAGLRIVGRPEP